jgi:hypothetical protein
MLSRPSVSVVVADILYALAGDGVPAAPGGVEAHVQSQAADAMTIHIYLEHSMAPRACAAYSPSLYCHNGDELGATESYPTALCPLSLPFFSFDGPLTQGMYARHVLCLFFFICCWLVNNELYARHVLCLFFFICCCLVNNELIGNK